MAAVQPTRGDENQKMACREKYFSEMDGSQRIQKLASELQRTQEQLKEACSIISELMRHEHCNNKILTPIKDNHHVGGDMYFWTSDFKK